MAQADLGDGHALVAADQDLRHLALRLVGGHHPLFEVGTRLVAKQLGPHVAPVGGVGDVVRVEQVVEVLERAGRLPVVDAQDDVALAVLEGTDQCLCLGTLRLIEPAAIGRIGRLHPADDAV